MDRDRPRLPANRNWYRLSHVSRALAQISCWMIAELLCMCTEYADYCGTCWTSLLLWHCFITYLVLLSLTIVSGVLSVTMISLHLSVMKQACFNIVSSVHCVTKQVTVHQLVQFFKNNILHGSVAMPLRHNGQFCGKFSLRKKFGKSVTVGQTCQIMQSLIFCWNVLDALILGGPKKIC